MGAAAQEQALDTGTDCTWLVRPSWSRAGEPPCSYNCSRIEPLACFDLSFKGELANKGSFSSVPDAKNGGEEVAGREWGEICLWLKCIRDFFRKEKPKVSVLVSLKCRVQCKTEDLHLGVNSF